MKKILVVLLALAVGLAFGVAQQDKAPKVEKKAAQVDCGKDGKEGCAGEVGCTDDKAGKASVKSEKVKNSADCCSEGSDVKVKKEAKAKQEGKMKKETKAAAGEKK